MSRADEELAIAQKYTNELIAERPGAVAGAVQLQADQGVALRLLIYYCTAAIVAALERQP